MAQNYKFEGVDIEQHDFRNELEEPLYGDPETPKYRSARSRKLLYFPETVWDSTRRLCVWRVFRWSGAEWEDQDDQIWCVLLKKLESWR